MKNLPASNVACVGSQKPFVIAIAVLCLAGLAMNPAAAGEGKVTTKELKGKAGYVVTVGGEVADKRAAVKAALDKEAAAGLIKATDIEIESYSRANGREATERKYPRGNVTHNTDKVLGAEERERLNRLSEVERERQLKALLKEEKYRKKAEALKEGGSSSTLYDYETKPMSTGLIDAYLRSWMSYTLFTNGPLSGSHSVGWWGASPRADQLKMASGWTFSGISVTVSWPPSATTQKDSASWSDECYDCYYRSLSYSGFGVSGYVIRRTESVTGSFRFGSNWYAVQAYSADWL